MTTTYAITGANRGVGRALTEIILARPNHRVFALVRDTSDSTSQSLSTQGTADGSSVSLIQYDASKPDSADQAYEELKSKHNVETIDIVIANAGTIGTTGTLAEIPASAYQDVLATNTIGPIMLLKAMFPLLQNSKSPKFIAISSAIGSTEMIPKRSGVATALGYGISKAALNHAICKLNQVHSEITFGILTPGVTRSNFMGPSFDWSKMPHANTVETVAPGLMKMIDETERTKQGENPVFRDWKGEVVPW